MAEAVLPRPERGSSILRVGHTTLGRAVPSTGQEPQRDRAPSTGPLNRPAPVKAAVIAHRPLPGAALATNVARPRRQGTPTNGAPLLLRHGAVPRTKVRRAGTTIPTPRLREVAPLPEAPPSPRQAEVLLQAAAPWEVAAAGVPVAAVAAEAAGALAAAGGNASQTINLSRKALERAGGTGFIQ